MKKQAFAFILLVAAASANANQCPPADALSHPIASQHWKLDQQYTDKGWYVAVYPYSDTSKFTKLPKRSGDGLIVSFVSNEDQALSQWFVTCEYSIWDSAFPRRVVVTNNQFLTFDPIKNPVPNFYNANPDQKLASKFTCNTSYDNLSGCTWEETK